MTFLSITNYFGWFKPYKVCKTNPNIGTLQRMNTDLLRTAFLIKFCCVQPYIEKYGYQTASRGQEGHKISGSKAEELQDKEQQGSILFCLATTSLVVATVLARLCISVLVHPFPSPRLSHF